ncbi:hypothetical protein LJC07_03765 [Christensenellaceae bacterium OttesenSCG-928-L17]|nr:hypothetical protein [Christensenellaceae bacterium OttesenSCG-928-L17]
MWKRKWRSGIVAYGGDIFFCVGVCSGYNAFGNGFNVSPPLGGDGILFYLKSGKTTFPPTPPSFMGAEQYRRSSTQVLSQRFFFRSCAQNNFRPSLRIAAIPTEKMSVHARNFYAKRLHQRQGARGAQPARY